MTDTRSDPTAPDNQLLDRLEHWQALHQQGQSVSLADVCADRPELAAPLERLAQFVRQVETLAADPTLQTTGQPGNPLTLSEGQASPTARVPVGERYAFEGKPGE